MPRLKPGTLIPTPEEEARINEGIAQDPDSPELDDEWFASARPAIEVFGEEFIRGMRNAKFIEVPDEIWNDPKLWKEFLERESQESSDSRTVL